MLAALSIWAAAITAGAPSSDAAVVALVRGDDLVCSGVVIGPRAVLTAAHCATAGATEVVVGEMITGGAGGAGGGSRVAVIGWRIDPQFEPATLAHDVAIAIVDPPFESSAGSTSSGPIADPLPLTDAPDALAVGETIRVVGFGLVSAADTTAPARRTGTSTIAALDALSLSTTPAPSQTCDGDSGGPALAPSPGGASGASAGASAGGEVIVGVASSGDAACTGGARHARIAAARAFLDATVAAIADGAAGPGDRCADDANCAPGAGPCLPAPDDPSWSFCTPPCADGACPAGLACLVNPADASAGAACRHDAPSPGAIGAPCASRADCAGALCLAPAAGGDATCTAACFPDLPGFCAAGAACALATDGTDACFAAEPSSRGGCAASRDPGGALMFALALVTLRARRRLTSRRSS